MVLKCVCCMCLCMWTWVQTCMHVPVPVEAREAIGYPAPALSALLHGDREPGLAWASLAASKPHPLPLPTTAQYSHTRLLHALNSSLLPDATISSALQPAFFHSTGPISLPRLGIWKEQLCEWLSVLRAVPFQARDKSVS